MLGIALGVAVAVSIDLANDSARRAFALATEAVTGRATHQIVGGPVGLPDERLSRACALELGVRRGRAGGGRATWRAPDRPGARSTVLGVDPFAEAPFRPYLGATDARGRGRDPLGTRRRSRGAAGRGADRRPTARAARARGRRPARRRASPAVDASLTLIGEPRARRPPSARALEGLLVTDIATAQELFGARRAG